jgi:hypothetical protein
MNVRGLAVALFCAAVPFTVSCAQSDDFDIASSSSLTPGGDATGGSATVGFGGSSGAVDATGGRTGGLAGNAMVTTGGSSGQPATGGSGQGTGGSASTGSGGVPSSTGTGGLATGGTGQPRPTTGGTTGAMTGGTMGATGGTMGAMGGRAGSTGGTTGATGGTMGATGGSSGTGSTAGATIVPLYTDPTDRSWTAIVTAALAHPTVEVVAIVNPADGPGSSKSADYTAGIATLQAAHIKVIGYVATGYGANAISSVESDMDRWKSFYPTVQGIFFDEQSNNPADVAHYKTLSQYAKSKGLAYTVGNPGTDVPTSYIGVLDTMMVYESDGLPTIASLKAWSAYAPSNFGIIPYKCSMDASFVKQARQYIRYIYLQSDDLPNPWDSLTTFFNDLMASLE